MMKLHHNISGERTSLSVGLATTISSNAAPLRTLRTPRIATWTARIQPSAGSSGEHVNNATERKLTKYAPFCGGLWSVGHFAQHGCHSLSFLEEAFAKSVLVTPVTPPVAKLATVCMTVNAQIVNNPHSQIGAYAKTGRHGQFSGQKGSPPHIVFLHNNNTLNAHIYTHTLNNKNQ
jgi:hypothetical protein